MQFADRVEAGRRLAEALRGRVSADAIVLALPRGGVPVGFEVADELGLPLDVIVVRKVGAPLQPEFALGAVGEGGVTVFNERIAAHLPQRPGEFERVARGERAELERRTARFREGRAALSLIGREVVIVDDGIATGSTARAACAVARARGARRVVLATPVAPHGVEQRMSDVADEVVCVHEPSEFFSVGGFYTHFAQTPDEEVSELLRRAAQRRT
ncbi:MAG TPA: phosphoribosyltransferase family protein [Jatrophihabitans sp.]|nr:phosphoribosyltransferase family protein [Jatrophihabitans sp.]